MKNILKLSLVICALTFAACGNKGLGTDVEGSENLTSLDGKSLPPQVGLLRGDINSVVIERSGWFPGPSRDYPFGIRIELQLRSDLQIVELSSYDLTHAKPDGQVKCHRTFINAKHFQEVLDGTRSLRMGSTEVSMIDGGDAYLTLTNTKGESFRGLLEQSDSAYGKSVIISAQDLHVKINQLLTLCQQGLVK